jgi:hypothetical protein
LKRNTGLVTFFFAVVLCLLPVLAQAIDEKTIELTVVKNDNLINICKKYLDEPSQWPEIARINHLKNPDLIYQHQRLVIPVHFLKGLPVNGRVIFIKGDVTVRSAPGETWKTLKMGEFIQQGNIIRTGAESVVEIIFDDGTSFFQRAETILDVHTTQRKGGSMLWQRFVLQGGQLFLKVRRSLGQESRIEIQTPAAVAVARGTDFRVSLDTRQSMTSEVLEGKVDVKAREQVVALNEGEGTRVNMGEPPQKPRKLLLPPHPLELQALYRMMPFRVQFQNVEGAAAYRIGLSTDAEGKNVIRENIVRSGEALELSGLEDGEYYLSGRSIDAVGIEGFSSAGQKIQVRVNPLPPFIQGPADGVKHKGNSVSFHWLKVPQAVRYALEVSPSREFADGTGERIDTIETTYHRTFQNFGTYYFHVRSQAADGFEGIWSDTLTFTLIPPPPAPLLDKPAMDEKELRIRWKDQGEKMTYRCQIARDERFTNPLVEQKVNKPEIILPRPVEPGLYYVRTSAIDVDGYEGGFSVPQSFEIKSNEKWVVLGTYGLMVLMILLLP